MQLDTTTQIFAIVILIISVIIHEVAHGYAANALGDPTAKLQGRLTLNPLRHIDPIGSIIIPAFLIFSHSGLMFGWAKPVPYNPYNLKNQRWGEAIVGVAGVATNLFLALIFGLLARMAYSNGLAAAGDLSALITLVNLSLGLFNLIPVPPLDGYTVVRGLLPTRYAMAFADFDMRMRRGGILTLILVLLAFNLLLAGPFYALVQYLFHVLVG